MIKKTALILFVIVFISYLIFVNRLSKNLKLSTENKIVQDFAKYQEVLDTSLSSLILLEISKMEQELIVARQLESVNTIDSETCNQDLLAVRDSTDSLLDNITRVDSEGVFSCSTNPNNIGVEGIKYDYINKILNDPDHKTVLSNPFLVQRGGNPSIIFAIHVPVYDSDENFTGTLGGTFYIEDIVQKFLDNNDMSNNSWPVVMQIPDGNILYHPDKTFLNTSVFDEKFSSLLSKNEDVGELLNKAIFEDNSQERYYTYNGLYNLGSINHIEPVAGSKWSILISSSLDDVYSDVAKYINNQERLYLSLVSVTVIGAVAILFVLARGNNLLKKQVDEKTKSLKRQTLELQHSTIELSKFKLAADSASDHIIITDVDGFILYANDAVEKITGYSKSEIIGKKAGSKDLWGGLMPKDFYKDMWKTIKVDKKSFVGEITNKRKNGVKYKALSTISPVFDNNGDIEFYVGIERDITKEKQIDEMKTDFVSLASHQLRTPLSSMKWFLEMLLDGDAGKLTKEQEEYLINIDKSNERMIKLVSDLLNVSRIESGRIIIDPKPTNLHKLVNSVIKESSVLAKSKDIKVTQSLYSKIPKIKIDPTLIQNVYLNLVTNAIKYSNRGGQVTIFVSKKDDYIVSQVADDGIGIPKQDQSRVFEKFYRSANARDIESDGSGLGLYLARAIIESSGGKIWFKSIEGKGTSFFFTIPISGTKPKKGEVRLNS